METSYSRIITAIIFACAMHGCGVAHVQTDIASDNLSTYRAAYIKVIKVYSLEESAKTNVPLHVKLQEWKQFADNELSTYLASSNLEIVDSGSSLQKEILAFEIDSNVTYGNRALRWAIGGFGPGNGGVVSSLEVSDAKSGEVYYRSTSKSDLSSGGAGGDMETVFKNNIKELLLQFENEYSF